MKGLLYIFSIIAISIPISLLGQSYDSTLIYYRTLEYHLSGYQNNEFRNNDSDENKSNEFDILLVLPDHISSNFPDTCSGYNLKIIKHATLVQFILKGRKAIDFLEVEQSYISENGLLVIPIADRIAVKKRKGILIGIYTGFYYQVWIDNDFNDINIKKLPGHYH